MQEVLFHFGGSTAVLRFLARLRKPQAIQKVCGEKKKIS